MRAAVIAITIIVDFHFMRVHFEFLLDEYDKIFEQQVTEKLPASSIGSVIRQIATPAIKQQERASK